MTAFDPLLIVVTLACLALVELAKAARWRELFGALRPDYPRCLRALVAGQLANALLPVRGGEVVRLGLIALEGGSAFAAGAALALAKVVDALCLAAIALAVGAAAVSPGWRVAAPAAVLFGALLLALRADSVRGWFERLPVLRRLRVRDALEAAVALRSPRTVELVTVATAVVWAAGLGANLAVLGAVGAPPSLDLAARMLLAVYLVGLLPAPPGRLVVYEAGVSGALVSGGVDAATALTASVALHLCQFAELALLLGLSVLLSRRRPRADAGASA